MNTLPYIDHKTSTQIKLLVVEPLPKESTITDAGVFIAADVGDDCEEGLVFSHDVDSVFKKGNRIVYKKIDRTKKENYETVEMSGKEYDIIGESEVWELDGKPFNRIFVEPLSEVKVGDGDIYIPDSVEGITQKGRIHMAPEGASVKAGDAIEYRKNTMGIYHTANIDGVDYEILYESDIFLINGKVSPYKIIVKIDLAEQQLKRQTNEMGIQLSPLFQRMTRMLQYGKVTEIGAEAQKMYPDLRRGDTAILHHGVEYDEYRILKRKRGQYAYTYEYRMINCFDITQREIFGKMELKREHHKITGVNIVPFHKNIFLDWDFEMLEKEGHRSEILEIDYALSDCRNKEDLENLMNKKREASVYLAKSKMEGLKADMERYNPHIEEENMIMRNIGARMDALKIDAKKAADYVNKNHVVKATLLYPKQKNNVVLTQYKHLYPINILGKKYLIGHSDLLMATQMENTKSFRWQPIGDQVIVRPVADESASNLFIPDSAKEKPQKAVVVAVGMDVNPDEIQVGDPVYHRKMAGTELVIDEVGYIMMRRNDVFLSPSVEEREVLKAGVQA